MKNKHTPEVRFEGFTDAWEQCKLGDIGGFKNGMNFGKEAMGHGHPFVNLQDIFGENVVNDSNLGLAESSENQRREYSLNKGDVLFIRSSVKPEGVGETALVPHDFPDTTYSGFIIRFRPNVQMADEFKRFAFSTKHVREQIMARATSSANTNINQESLQKIQLKLPNFKEQLKIGAFFKEIDNLITLQQQELTTLKQTKQGFLQKMFPKEGESVPEVRFPGFSGDWEQRTLGEISESFEYGLNASATEYDGENKYIRITDIDDNTHEFLEENLTSPNIDLSSAENYLVKEGDILFARTGASVGKSYIYDKKDGKVYYAGFLIRARIKSGYDPGFIFQNTLTSKYSKFIKVTSQRSGQPGVNAQEYANFSLMVPNNGEQTKIGNFFKQLDDMISLHQRELDALKETKKAFLQKIFV